MKQERISQQKRIRMLEKEMLFLTIKIKELQKLLGKQSLASLNSVRSEQKIKKIQYRNVFDIPTKNSKSL